MAHMASVTSAVSGSTASYIDPVTETRVLASRGNGLRFERENRLSYHDDISCNV